MHPKSKSYSIELNVHPAVKRWIDSSFPLENNSYDIRKESFYIVFQASLFRKDIKPPTKHLKKVEKFVPIRILIDQWDFYHFGWTIPTFAQIRISNLFFDLMMLNFCEHIAYAYAYSGIPRDVTTKRILVECLFDDDEINYHYIRKYYQRKYQQTGKEQQIIDFAKYTMYNLTQS
jgi:hypothetical protein